MATPEPVHRGTTDGPISRAELEADIVRTREQLGHTVDALTERLDVRSRASESLRGVRSSTALPYLAAAAAIATGAVASAVWSRRT